MSYRIDKNSLHCEYIKGIRVIMGCSSHYLVDTKGRLQYLASVITRRLNRMLDNFQRNIE